MKRYRVLLKGTKPLLQGRKDPREDSAPRAEPARTQWYDDQWRYTHYADTDGILGQPSHVLKAVIVAGLRETAKIGDIRAGKGKTEELARACLRVEPPFPKFNDGTVKVPTKPEFLGPWEAELRSPDGKVEVFVLKRLTSRGVEVTNLAIVGYLLGFELLDSSVTPIDPKGFFSQESLRIGLDYGFGIIGMGTWRPDFGLAEVIEFELIE